MSKRLIAAIAIALQCACAGSWRRLRIAVAGVAVAVLAAGGGGSASTTNSTSAAQSPARTSTASAPSGWSGMGAPLSAFATAHPLRRAVASLVATEAALPTPEHASAASSWNCRQPGRRIIASRAIRRRSQQHAGCGSETRGSHPDARRHHDDRVLPPPRLKSFLSDAGGGCLRQHEYEALRHRGSSSCGRRSHGHVAGPRV